MEEVTPTVQFDWAVQRLSSRLDRAVVSPTFQTAKNGSWSLMLFPNLITFDNGDDNNNSSKYLILTNDLSSSGTSTTKLSGHFQVRLLDRHRAPWIATKMENCDFSKESHSLPFLFPEDLRSPRWDELVQDDSLRIQVSVWIHRIETGGGDTLSASTMTTTTKDKALEDFGALINDSDYADVIIVTKAKTFRAHKVILSARSKVFKAMFKTPAMTEEAVVLNASSDDFDEGAIEGMLQHVYRGVVDNLGDKARSLLKVGDKYDLPGLKEEAEDQVANSLTVETAADDLILAHMANATLLKSKVVQFINRNKKRVRETAAFQRVLKSNPVLLLELLYLSSESEQ